MTDLKLLLVMFYIQSFCVSFTISIKAYDTEENVEEIEDSGIETTAMTSEEPEMTRAVSSDMLSTDKTRETEESTSKTTNFNEYERTITKPMPESIKKQQIATEDEAPVEFIAKKNNKSQLCPFFIYSAGFDMDKMEDVWQSVYYKMPDRLACFKILVRKTYQKERSENEDRYGNFNKSVDWKECHFEVRSSSTTFRKHYLQGGVADMGVMRNIVLIPDENDEYKLQEESPDQWLMLKGLLLLRDCDNGGMVAFSRVPQRARTEDILEALNELGEEMTGDLLCEDPE